MFLNHTQECVLETRRCDNTMLREVLETEKTKTQTKYQVLFLSNDHTDEVEVHDVKEVDFQTIQERLAQGESVFITSKRTQKITPPKPKTRLPKTRLATAFTFETN